MADDIKKSQSGIKITENKKSQKLYYVECPFDDFRSKEMDHLIKHIVDDHIKNIYFECPFNDGILWGTLEELMSHIKNSHTLKSDLRKNQNRNLNRAEIL
ncbi:MAG: hypothetical protein ACTSQQ_12750 [Candidatus Helarchaeota archaeon]